MSSLRLAALHPLNLDDPLEKAAATEALCLNLPTGRHDTLPDLQPFPGRPKRPTLRPNHEVKQASLQTVEGRAMLIHALAHIEFNAINLALDIVCRFAGMPDPFYRDWVSVAQDEARHFLMLREHLLTLGHDYGDFDAHNTLWEMAERTQGDLLARIALVPRTLEARGLDVSPAVKARLVNAGDHKAGAILDTILHDEIGHVAAGNRWYRQVCLDRGLDPVVTYAELLQCHQAPKPRGPFNMTARRLAGFEEEELMRLQWQGQH